MSNVLDKSFIHRSYPKLAYGSIYSTKVYKFKIKTEEKYQGFQLGVTLLAGILVHNTVDCNMLVVTQ